MIKYQQYCLEQAMMTFIGILYSDQPKYMHLIRYLNKRCDWYDPRLEKDGTVSYRYKIERFTASCNTLIDRGGWSVPQGSLKSRLEYMVRHGLTFEGH